MSFLDPKHLIDTFGLLGLTVVIFLESGIFPAPLPGDSLLFTAGLFAATNEFHLNIVAIVIASFLAAVAGAQKDGCETAAGESRVQSPIFAHKNFGNPLTMTLAPTWRAN